MSRNALEGKEVHSCMDDLESFYYVLVFIVLAYSGPKSPKDSIVSPLDDWRRPLAFKAKEGYFFFDFKYKLSDWFGAPFKNLAIQLHSIFKTHLIQRFIAEHQNTSQPVLDPAHVYDQFLAFTRCAIEEVEKEDAMERRERSASLQPDTTEPAANPGKRKSVVYDQEQDDQESLLYSWIKRDPRTCRDTSVQTTAAASRTRRDRAHYGITKVRIFF